MTATASASPTLFDRAGMPVPKKGLAHGKGPYPKRVMLKHESETLGFMLSQHPLELYRDLLRDVNHLPACELHEHVGRHVTTIGWLITGKTIRTKDGNQMKFISFEDTTGIYETVFFPKVYTRYCHMLNASRPYILKGRVDEEFSAICMTVN